MTYISAIQCALFCMIGLNAHAGCIGPVIMGECKGAIVPYDTHGDGMVRQTAPYGFHYDKRGTQYERNNLGMVNPFTGLDPHDANQALYERQQTKERACRQLRLQGIRPRECL